MSQRYFYQFMAGKWLFLVIKMQTIRFAKDVILVRMIEIRGFHL